MTFEPVVEVSFRVPIEFSANVCAQALLSRVTVPDFEPCSSLIRPLCFGYQFHV